MTFPTQQTFNGQKHGLAWITKAEADKLRKAGGGIDKDGEQIYRFGFPSFEEGDEDSPGGEVGGDPGMGDGAGTSDPGAESSDSSEGTGGSNDPGGADGPSDADNSAPDFDTTAQNKATGFDNALSDFFGLSRGHGYADAAGNVVGMGDPVSETPANLDLPHIQAIVTDYGLQGIPNLTNEMVDRAIAARSAHDPTSQQMAINDLTQANFDKANPNMASAMGYAPSIAGLGLPGYGIGLAALRSDTAQGFLDSIGTKLAGALPSNEAFDSSGNGDGPGPADTDNQTGVDVHGAKPNNTGISTPAPADHVPGQGYIGNYTYALSPYRGDIKTYGQRPEHMFFTREDVNG